MKRNMRSRLGLLLAPVGLMVAFLLVQGCKGTGNAPPTGGTGGDTSLTGTGGNSNGGI